VVKGEGVGEERPLSLWSLLQVRGDKGLEIYKVNSEMGGNYGEGPVLIVQLSCLCEGGAKRDQ